MAFMAETKNVSRKSGFIFDLVVVLLVLGLIGGGVYYFFRDSSSGKAEIEYMFVYEDVIYEISDKVVDGVRLMNDDGESMGTVKTVVRTGIAGTTNKDVYVTASATAKQEGTTYYLGGQSIKAGEYITVRTKDFYGIALVMSVVSKDGGK